MVQSLLEGPEDLDESELLDELAEFADKNGAYGSRVRMRHQVFLRRNLVQASVADGGTDDEEVSEPELDAAVQAIEKIAERDDLNPRNSIQSFSSQFHNVVVYVGCMHMANALSSQSAA